ncbi:MAG: sulfurtransferase-like selenium metabolism protein YedF [Clostridia bacterium]|nr:sulfurtransferase-like selenium metabolism protein YedF [Clostridia bacterium]
MREMSINCMGEKCPIPVVKTIKALNALTEKTLITVIVDNDTAVSNLSKLAKSRGFAFTTETLAENQFAVKIEADASETPEADPDAEAAVFCGPAAGPTVVVVSDKSMGGGSEELGAILMKGFIYAISQRETLPDTILFYNGGANYTCEGSPSLEDLKYMESQGTTILTCGTCLDFYGLKEKLAVGGVTNMYDIADRVMSAGKVVKP